MKPFQQFATSTTIKTPGQTQAQEGGEERKESGDRSQVEDTRGSMIDFEFTKEGAARDPHQYLSVITGSSRWNAVRVDS